MEVTLSPDEARQRLLAATDLVRPSHPRGRAGGRSALERLGCVQLDPIDRIGTNADLVFHARVDGWRRGDAGSLPEGCCFEHFAKERCLLPARAFPFYRDGAHRGDTGWWRQDARLSRLDLDVLAVVLAEVRDRGPLTAAAVGDHGRVRPLDWHGWQSTKRAGSMALEALWTRCEVVVCSRTADGKRSYDLPERALRHHHAAPGGHFERFALLERVRSAGLLSEAGGPWWSMLRHVRGGPLVDDLVASGELVRTRVTGSRRSLLALPAFFDAPIEPPDRRLRILAPLDALLWDRKLVQHLFDFEYLWEVYKPAERRRWGYYVCPLLHGGRLVGRIEARRDAGNIEIIGEWGQPPRAPLRRALDRLAAMQERR